MSASQTIELPALGARALPHRWTIESLVCWSMVVAVVFLNGADFRGGTGEEFRVHWQIYLRLLISCAAGCVGLLLLFPRSFRDFFTGAGLLVTAHASWYLLTLPGSVERTYSIAAWSSLVGVTLLIPGAMRVLGSSRMLGAVATGLTLYVAGSWVAYLYFPSVGIFHEYFNEREYYARMGGLGHPNELGFYSAFTVLVFAGLGVSGKLRWSLAAWGVLLGGVTLLACFSRTATIACAVGLLFTFQNHLRRRGNLTALVLATVALLAAAFVALGAGKFDWLARDAMLKLTKSGTTRELVTATGRTEIWAFGLEKVQQSPLLGYGYCAARFVMEEHSFHGHNVVLNAMLYGGVVAGLIVTGMVVLLGLDVLRQPLPLIDGLAICMLVGGAVDGLFPSASPAASTLLWLMLLFWRPLGMHRADRLQQLDESQSLLVRGGMIEDRLPPLPA